MAFVDIPTLDGGVAHIAATAVCRVTRSLDDDAPTAQARVEFGGDVQLTPDSVDAAAALLTRGGARLAPLTAPDGSAVFLGIDAVTGIRAADPHADPATAQAVVTFTGGRQAVQETPAQVQRLLSA